MGVALEVQQINHVQPSIINKTEGSGQCSNTQWLDNQMAPASDISNTISGRNPFGEGSLELVAGLLVFEYLLRGSDNEAARVPCADGADVTYPPG